MNNNLVPIDEVGLKIPEFTGKKSDFQILKGGKIPDSDILKEGKIPDSDILFGSKEGLKDSTVFISCPVKSNYSELKNTFGESICAEINKRSGTCGRIDIIMGHYSKYSGVILLRVSSNEHREIYIKDPSLRYLKAFSKNIIKMLKKLKINEGELLFSKNIKFIKVWVDNNEKKIDKKFSKIWKGRLVITFSIEWKTSKDTQVECSFNRSVYTYRF